MSPSQVRGLHVTEGWRDGCTRVVRTRIPPCDCSSPGRPRGTDRAASARVSGGCPCHRTAACKDGRANGERGSRGAEAHVVGTECCEASGCRAAPWAPCPRAQCRPSSPGRPSSAISDHTPCPSDWSPRCIRKVASSHDCHQVNVPETTGMTEPPPPRLLRFTGVYSPGELRDRTFMHRAWGHPRRHGYSKTTKFKTPRSPGQD